MGDEARRRPSRIATAILALGLLTSLLILIVPIVKWAHFGPYVAQRWMWIGGLGATLNAVALLAPSSWRSGFAVAMVSLVVSVYAFEFAIAFDLLEPDGLQDREEADWRARNPDYDTRMKIDVIRDLRTAGQDAWPDLGQATMFGGLVADGHRVVPISGVATATTVYCNESGQRTVYVADEHGFNNPLGLYEAPAHVIVVGDSFAHGACVPAGEDVSSQLRRRRPHDRIVNLGYGGAGPLTLQAMLAEYARRLRPRDVFWLYYSGNDLTDARLELGSDVLTRYLDDPEFTQDLWGLRPRFDPLMRAFIDDQEAKAQVRGAFVRRVPLGPSLKLNQVRRMVDLKPLPDPNELFARAAAAAKRRVDAWGGRLHFVYVWNWPHEADGAYYRKDEVLAIVRDLGMDVIDLRDLFGEEPAQYYPTPFGGHLNVKGYARLAEAMDAMITKTSTAR